MAVNMLEVIMFPLNTWFSSLHFITCLLIDAKRKAQSYPWDISSRWMGGCPLQCKLCDMKLCIHPSGWWVVGQRFYWLPARKHVPSVLLKFSLQLPCWHKKPLSPASAHICWTQTWGRVISQTARLLPSVAHRSLPPSLAPSSPLWSHTYLHATHTLPLASTVSVFLLISFTAVGRF